VLGGGWRGGVTQPAKAREYDMVFLNRMRRAMKPKFNLALGILAALLVGLPPGEAGAQAGAFKRAYAYVTASAGDEAQVGYINVDSIKTLGPKRVFWVLWIYKTPLKIGNLTVSYYLRQVEYDCFQSNSKGLFYSAYDEEGNVITSKASPPFEPARPVVPDTTGEDLLAFACEARSSVEGASDLTLNDAIADARSRP
jgi:hypothetical protein